MKQVNVAIVGATGAVGEVMLELLAERDFPAKAVSLLASERSAGARIPFKHQSITVQNLAEFDFSGTDIALFSAGGVSLRSLDQRPLVKGVSLSTIRLTSGGILIYRSLCPR